MFNYSQYWKNNDIKIYFNPNLGVGVILTTLLVLP